MGIAPVAVAASMNYLADRLRTTELELAQAKGNIAGLQEIIKEKEAVIASLTPAEEPPNGDTAVQ